MMSATFALNLRLTQVLLARPRFFSFFGQSMAQLTHNRRRVFPSTLPPASTGQGPARDCHNIRHANDQRSRSCCCPFVMRAASHAKVSPCSFFPLTGGPCERHQRRTMSPASKFESKKPSGAVVMVQALAAPHFLLPFQRYMWNATAGEALYPCSVSCFNLSNSRLGMQPTSTSTLDGRATLQPRASTRKLTLGARYNSDNRRSIVVFLPLFVVSASATPQESIQPRSA